MVEARAFANPYWRRLAGARPRLNDQARVSRHEIRGRLWYVVQDAISGRHFRLTPEAWYFVGLLDGTRTVDEAMHGAERHLGEAAPKQDDVIRLLNQLHSAGAISSIGSAPETSALYERSTKMRRRRLFQQLRSPLAIRMPLIDPDRMLERLKPLGRLVFSPFGFALWLGVVAYGISVAALNFDTLSHNFVDQVLSTENVALMLAVFGVMKLLHEFGHGLAVKRWGGETHEMGIMLLVLIPVPFVDASAANGFPSRFRRIVVSAAGMYVEAFLAALAIILWSSMEPGLVRAAMYNAALVGSISTLFFNANPLLRFDGYYILSDLASLPNLGTRGNLFVRYVLERWLLGLEDAATAESDPAEQRWLFIYAVAAAAYRIFIVGVIAFFVAQKFFFVGMLLAIWAIAQLVLVPVVGALYFLAFSPRLRDGRLRAWMRAGIAAAVIGALLFAVPAPRTTYATGVVWVPEEGELMAQIDGFVTRVAVPDGAAVGTGELLIVAENDQLVAERERLAARLDALEARARADFVSDKVALRLTRLETDHVERRIAELERKLDDLRLLAGIDGKFALAVPEDLIGRFIRRGERLGFIVPDAAPTIRVAVGQNEVGLVHGDLQRVDVLSVVPGSEPVEAEVTRAVPQASAELPSMALATFGGGDIEVAADENGNYRALKPLFHLELQLPTTAAGFHLGQKVHVKFVHGMEPVGVQTWRWLRQLFLSQLNV